MPKLQHRNESFLVSSVNYIFVTPGQNDGGTGGSQQWSPSRVWSIVITIAVCAMFILAFALIAMGYPNEGIDGHHYYPHKSAVPYGFRLPLPSGPLPHTSWTDVTIQLSTGVYTIAWTNLTSQDLDSPDGGATWHYGHPLTLGSLSVWLNVSDRAGNGYLDNGDFLTMTTGSDVSFLMNSTYALSLLYEPTGGSILSMIFTG